MPSFFVSIAFSFIAWSVVAARYIWPELHLQPRAAALRPLLPTARVQDHGPDLDCPSESFAWLGRNRRFPQGLPVPSADLPRRWIEIAALRLMLKPTGTGLRPFKHPLKKANGKFYGCNRRHSST
jgi:hypothetical protein